MESNTNTLKENHPFKKIAITSFISGGLSVLLAIVLLLSIKLDVQNKSYILVFEKLLVGLILLSSGIHCLWRGYKYEYDFNLTEIFDPKHGKPVNYLLGQRVKSGVNLALDYSQILRSKTFSPTKQEIGNVSDLQLLFYKLASKNKVPKLFDFLPYPITNFVAAQSTPVVLLGILSFLSLACLFVIYLADISFGIVWINLAILVALLVWWTPTKIDTLLKPKLDLNIQKKFILLIVFYLATVFFSKSSTNEISIGVFVALLVLAGVMVYTSLLSFNLINSVFTKRERVTVEVSEIDLVTQRVSTQPNNILQQFENGLEKSFGWFYRGSYGDDSKGVLAGDNNRKGDFKFGYVYETWPEIISTSYDDQSEVRLGKVWKIGTFVLCAGLLLIVVGAMLLPPLDINTIQNNTPEALRGFSPKMFTSVFIMILGIALYFFGKKLVYEIYTFFNTEVFFESNLIIFGAKGNFDEYEQIVGNIKRKDTSTDFTPNIKACKVISSVFIHPYIDNEKIMLSSQNRFLLGINSNDSLLKQVEHLFRSNISPYTMSRGDDNIFIQGRDETNTKGIDI